MKKSVIAHALLNPLLGCCDGGNTAFMKSDAGNDIKDLTYEIKPNKIDIPDDLPEYNEKITDFSVRLFKPIAESGNNILISPVSVLFALAMVSNGAQAETLRQFEEVFGIKRECLNLYLHSFMKKISEDNSNLHLADSAWFTNDKKFRINREFLQKNADYYGAEIFEAPMNDKTCEYINSWVNENTDGMIPKIVDDIPTNAVMYLINALAFNGKWNDKYTKSKIIERNFTCEDGSETLSKFMCSTENLYIRDKNASGFIKPYKGRKYAFAALIPEEGTGIGEYISSLDGARLHSILTRSERAEVSVRIPKFDSDFSFEMSGLLSKMGMPKAFDELKAEFAGLGTYENLNIYINRVLHKTHISVNEEGTKAGAATAVEMFRAMCFMPTIKETVYLNRPFLYMIIDYENSIPLFIGTMMDPGK